MYVCVWGGWMGGAKRVTGGSETQRGKERDVETEKCQ